MTIRLINLALGIAGISFQAFILLPCHNIISEQMEGLEQGMKKIDHMNQELVKYLL